MKIFHNLGWLALLVSSFVFAQDEQALKKVKVVDNVWAIVGPLTNRTPENLGNNATFGLVITSDGAVLIDSGGSRLGAIALHKQIKAITDKPVRFVINTGGQDHRWFGNDYFSSLGAKIISSKAARIDHEKRLNDQWSRMETLIGKKGMHGTKEKYADILFDSDYRFSLGGVEFEISFRGQAHTPGDSFVWLPKQRVMFTGDIVYTERMLGVGSQSNSKTWVKVYESMAAFKPDYVVPGHGQPTTIKKSDTDTYQYLTFLRKAVTDFMDEGKDISEIGKLDQSKFSYLKNYETLKGRNAQKVFSELEWE